MTDSKLIAVSNVAAALITKGAPISNRSQVVQIVNTAMEILSVAENQERALAKAAERSTDSQKTPGKPFYAGEYAQPIVTTAKDRP